MYIETKFHFLSLPEDHTGLGSTPLWASVLHTTNSQDAVVWRPEATSVRGWREATIFLGRIPTTFQIHLHSQRSVGQRGDVAIDQMEFLDCALPCECLIISFSHDQLKLHSHGQVICKHTIYNLIILMLHTFILLCQEFSYKRNTKLTYIYIYI